MGEINDNLDKLVKKFHKILEGEPEYDEEPEETVVEE
jgi:hypothetical protein